jgi:hypothetical protein
VTPSATRGRLPFVKAIRLFTQTPEQKTAVAARQLPWTEPSRFTRRLRKLEAETSALTQPILRR